MPANFNSLTLAGTVVTEPEIRYAQSGKAVCKCRLAVAPAKKNPRPEESLFITVVTFERTAETMNQYVKRGGGLLVHGELQVRGYEKGDGTKGVSVELLARTMQMLGGRHPKDESVGRPAERGEIPLDETDDIPF